MNSRPHKSLHQSECSGCSSAAHETQGSTRVTGGSIIGRALDTGHIADADCCCCRRHPPTTGLRGPRIDSEDPHLTQTAPSRSHQVASFRQVSKRSPLTLIDRMTLRILRSRLERGGPSAGPCGRTQLPPGSEASSMPCRRADTRISEFTEQSDYHYKTRGLALSPATTSCPISGIMTSWRCRAVNRSNSTLPRSPGVTRALRGQAAESAEGKGPVRSPRYVKAIDSHSAALPPPYGEPHRGQ